MVEALTGAGRRIDLIGARCRAVVGLDAGPSAESAREGELPRACDKPQVLAR
mgnify:CR=1 FL=1